MKKTFKILFKTFTFTLITLLLLLIGTFAYFQTPWGKTFWKDQLQEFAAKKNITLEIGEVTGSFPFTYQVKKLVIPYDVDRSVSVDEGEISIDWLALLQKKLKISELTAQKIEFISPQKTLSSSTTIVEEKPSQTPQSSWPTPPIAFEIASFSLKEFQPPIEGNKVTFQVSGSAAIAKDGKSFSIKIHASPQNHPELSLALAVKGDKENNSVVSQVDIKGQSVKGLAPLIKLPFDAKGTLKTVAKGTLESYLNLFQETQQTSQQPLKGHFKGSVTPSKLPIEIAPYAETPFDITGSFTSEGPRLIIDPLNISNPFILAKGKANFNKNFDFQELTLQYTTSDIQTFLPKGVDVDILGHLSGQLQVTPKVTESPIEVSFSIPNLIVNEESFKDTNGTVTTKIESNNSLSGKLNFSTMALQEEFSYKSDYLFEPKNKNFHLKDINIHSPSTLLEGDIAFTSEGKYLGDIYSELQSITLLERFAKNVKPLKGRAFINLSFHEKNKKQTVVAKTTLSSFILSELQGEKLSIVLDITDPFSNKPEGSLSLDMQKAAIKDLDINSMKLTTSNTDENWPFDIDLKGDWNGLIEIQSDGYWKWKDNSALINLQKFQGIRKTHPFLAPKPIELTITPDGMDLKNLFLEMDNGSLQSHLSLSKDHVDIGLILNEFPIEVLAVVFPEIPFQGVVNLEASLQKNKDDLTSQISLNFADLQIEPIGEAQPLIAKGFIKGLVVDNELKAEGKMTLQNNETFEMDATLPIKVKNYPFSISIPQNRDVKASVSFHGQVEDFLDFINIGPQRLEGKLDCQFDLSNTLSSPHVLGEGTLTHGKYEQYESGVLIKNIEAKLKASNKKVSLVSLKGDGGKGGSLIAKGLMELSKKEFFPFFLTARMNDLSGISSPTVSATIDGDVKIEGNSKGAKIEGDVGVLKGIFSVPDKLSKPLPILDIVFVNAPPSQEKKEKELFEDSFPIEVDLRIKAPNNLLLNGKGLSSEWKGKLTLGGTLDNLLPEGKLSLIRGNYTFSGRTFNLSEGKVLFTGIPGAQPQLDITGNLTSAGTEIMANVKGSVLKPKITFTSQPPLSLGSIISLLLFGHDISEISPLQAAQLATAFTSFSEGAGLLDKTKQSLGIDRFSIVSVPTNTDESPEQLAVQVGKYVAKGVLVTLSQGTEQGSSNIIVDVDLTNGFLFSAETQQLEEQGKFSFKWHHNY